ncbi:MAG: Gfo/Idh/MocA family oxidoreductase [Verrucomicrobiales bacterium]|nr:Gfo/Idh/MocA family oxidoreductase [Verrucomicrobiales bacterium]
MEKVRLGLVGLGNMGKTHRTNLRAGNVRGLELAAICDRPASLPDAVEGERQFSDVNQMIQSGAIDAILIATPHFSHTTIGIAALQAGLHVCVEKPLSVHKADCERLIAAHQDKSLIFSAMFQMRTDPLWKTVKDLVASGELGTIRRIHWDCSDWFRTEYYYASGGWRATWKGEGGGVLLNQCPHNLDLYQWLFGMPSQVHGFCNFGRYHQIEVEDDVTAYFRYPDGKNAVFITSTGETPGKNCLEIIAERGLVTIEKGRISWVRNKVPMTQWSNDVYSGFAKPDTWSVDIPVTGQSGQHTEILQNFTDAILHGEKLLTPAAEGIHSIELANSILMSAWMGRTLDLPLDSAAYERELLHRADTSTFQKKTLDPQKGKISQDDFAKSFR